MRCRRNVYKRKRRRIHRPIVAPPSQTTRNTGHHRVKLFACSRSHHSSNVARLRTKPNPLPPRNPLSPVAIINSVRSFAPNPYGNSAPSRRNNPEHHRRNFPPLLSTPAAIAPLDQTGWIRVTGEDRVRWLNGMVTNSIQDLAPGQGNYNFVLNAQGRIQGDLTAWMLEDSILLEITCDQLENLTAYFDRFIIMDDVELSPMPRKTRTL